MNVNFFLTTTHMVAIMLVCAVIVLSLIACGPDDLESQSTPVIEAITADLCTEGEGRKTTLYVRNLDDFEWIGVKIDLIKGGETYSMTLDNLLPETDNSADPFTDSTKFYYWFGGAEQKPGGRTGISLNARNSEKFVLTNFSYLQTAAVEVQLPFPAKWTGEPNPC